jgi:hypothetical protein
MRAYLFSLDGVRASVVVACVIGLFSIAIPIVVYLQGGLTNPTDEENQKWVMECIRALCGNALPVLGLAIGHYWVRGGKNRRYADIAGPIAFAIHALAWGYLVLFPLLILVPWSALFHDADESAPQKPIIANPVPYIDYIRIMLGTALMALFGPAFGTTPAELPDVSATALPKVPDHSDKSAVPDAKKAT